MAGLLRAYTHHVHRRHGLVGRMWQGRFKSPAIEAERYALSCGSYIERNPLEAGLVAQPWDYRWSSCRAYALVCQGMNRLRMLLSAGQQGSEAEG
jgi:putative transposase